MRNEVRLFRDAAETHGRDLFECSLAEWEFFLELGRAFGWREEGSTYELPAGSKVAMAARRDYEPGAPADRKMVDEQDALNWGRALEDAVRSSELAHVIATRLSAQSRGIATSVMTNKLHEFIQYAYGGRFTFAREVEGQKA